MKREYRIGIVVLCLLLMPILTPTSSASNQSQHSTSNVKLRAIPRIGAEVQVIEGGKMQCREATPEEALVIMRRDPNLRLHQITPANPKKLNDSSDGLKIIFRATSQLENFPAAKEAFLKAAAEWESIIQNPITIVADVDFGPTDFGEPFDPDNLGITHYQAFGYEDIYPTVRSKLIAGASTAEEASLYSLLPDSAVPTDRGNTAGVYAPSSLFRALGIINPVPDPEGELEEFGPPPTIAFNSAFEYDFDPSDGVDEDKFNFLSLAEHEIGHLLGFFTLTGYHELYPDEPSGVSVWDLCRFRPGISLENFASAPRVLSSGGEHVFFSGREEVQLSTGRPDKIGGDNQQPSHWKADDLTDRYIGIMDPTLGEGELNPITHDDLDALDSMGYRIARDSEGIPVIQNLAASLDGDELSLNGTAADRNGDIVQAQVKLFDGDGINVAQTIPFVINVGTSSEVSFEFSVTNLNSFPTTVQVRVILIDRDGNTSAPAIADFNQADAGGPRLSGVSFNGKKLKLKGNAFDGDIVVEINGVIVAEGTNEEARKILIKGTPSSLNLQSGPNRIRVRKNNLRSNIYIFDF